MKLLFNDFIDNLVNIIITIFIFILIMLAIWYLLTIFLGTWWNTWGIWFIGICVAFVVIILIVYFYKVSSFSYNISTPLPTKNSIDRNRENYYTSDYSTSELDEILNKIEENFKPELIRDEEDFEKQLFQVLKLLYPDRVSRQVKIGKLKADIVFDNNVYGLELKIANNRGILTSLIGQITLYKEVFNEIAVILLDVNALSIEDLNEFIGRYKNMGVKTLVIKGEYRKKNRKREFIIRNK